MATIPRLSGFLRVDDLGADTASTPIYGSRSRLLDYLFRFVLLVCCGHSLMVFPFSQDAGHSLGKNQDGLQDIHRNSFWEMLESFGIDYDFTHLYAS